MNIKLKHHAEPVDATLDLDFGIITAAVYSDTGIPLDEVEILELELDYSDVLTEYFKGE